MSRYVHTLYFMICHHLACIFQEKFQLAWTVHRNLIGDNMLIQLDFTLYLNYLPGVRCGMIVLPTSLHRIIILRV